MILKQLRKKKGFTQSEMADELGVALRTIQSWEGNERNLSLKNAKTIADYFGISVEEVMGYKDVQESAVMYGNKPIDRKLINEYLNEVGKRTSNRNRNNQRSVLSAIFSELVEQELIPSNFIREMRNVKSVPERHRAFSPNEVDLIFANCSKPLYWYLAHVYYGLFRPIEAVRIKVKHIRGDMIISNTKTFKFHKQIPSKLFELYRSIDLSNSDNYVLTKDGVGKWEASERDRRGYFGKQFNKVRDKLGFSSEYTVYSLRHSAIGRLYAEKRKEMNEDEAINYIRSITAHQTNEAVRKYLREIGYYKIEDWSDLL